MNLMKKTKKLGIIGGMGSRACSLFFNKVIDYCPADKDQDFIEIVVHNNTDIPDRTRAIIYNEASPLKEIKRSIRLLDRSGVDVIVLTCNTAYYFYDQFSHFAQARILHPVELVRQHLQEGRFSKVGLLATTGTIQSGIYHKEFWKHGIPLLTLDPGDQEDLFMRSVYMENGLKSSSISNSAIRLMHTAMQRLLDMGADAIIGGCTEVPLALNADNVPVPFIDPMDVLARAVIAACYEPAPAAELAAV
jgi:aspartate racemase